MQQAHPSRVAGEELKLRPGALATRAEGQDVVLRESAAVVTSNRSNHRAYAEWAEGNGLLPVPCLQELLQVP